MDHPVNLALGAQWYENPALLMLFVPCCLVALLILYLVDQSRYKERPGETKAETIKRRKDTTHSVKRTLLLISIAVVIGGGITIALHFMSSNNYPSGMFGIHWGRVECLERGIVAVAVGIFVVLAVALIKPREKDAVQPPEKDDPPSP